MKNKSHQDLSFTDEQFYELVDFFRDLIRLDGNTEKRNLRRNQQKFLRLLKNRTQQIKEEKRLDLLQQLERLEQF